MISSPAKGESPDLHFLVIRVGFFKLYTQYFASGDLIQTGSKSSTIIRLHCLKAIAVLPKNNAIKQFLSQIF
jgi:hypothetical protein